MELANKPLIEDPASEGSGVSGPGRLLQYCRACSTVSLTGFTYIEYKEHLKDPAMILKGKKSFRYSSLSNTNLVKTT